MKDKELYLLTKLDFGGNVLEPSMRFRCEPDEATLMAVLGELTNLAPLRRDGSPNPDAIPAEPLGQDGEPTRCVLDWDEFSSPGEREDPAACCVAHYYRTDLLDYYELENLDRIRSEPLFLEGSMKQIGSEDGCVDVEV